MIGNYNKESEKKKEIITVIIIRFSLSFNKIDFVNNPWDLISIYMKNINLICFQINYILLVCALRNTNPNCEL